MNEFPQEYNSGCVMVSTSDFRRNKPDSMPVLIHKTVKQPGKSCEPLQIYKIAVIERMLNKIH